MDGLKLLESHTVLCLEPYSKPQWSTLSLVLLRVCSLIKRYAQVSTRSINYDFVYSGSCALLTGTKIGWKPEVHVAHINCSHRES